MRLRDLFRGPTNNERKLTPSILPVLDTSSFLNAAQDKDTDTLQRYLLAGFPPDQADATTKTTALHSATEVANVRGVQILLQAGAQINVCDSNQSTSLHIAAYLGHEEIVQILLTHDADILKQDNTGRNPFHLAVSTGNNRLIQHFFSNTDVEKNLIDLPDAQNWTPLMCACASNHPSTCALLLSHNADLSAVNDRGMNVFHISAFLGSLSMISELMNSSIDDEIILKALNTGDFRNQTPLFYACCEGHLDIALILLNAGANVYHLDNDNQTCLHAMLSSSIILKRHLRLFYRFIEYVDFRLNQDNFSRTLLDLAYLNQLNSIIYLLTLLDYKRNYTIISNTEYNENLPKQVLSLRHLCVISFKRHIIYQRNKKQMSQHDLLEYALQQSFQIDIQNDIGLIDTNYRKSLDDISLSNKKTTKSSKKTRKTLNIFSTVQNDLEQQPLQTQSSWSLFTNKFKHQRASNSQQDTSLSLPSPTGSIINSSQHPMKNLVLNLLLTSNKLDDLLDFPSINNNHLIDEDIKSTMNTYNLDGIDSSNQI